MIEEDDVQRIFVVFNWIEPRNFENKEIVISSVRVTKKFKSLTKAWADRQQVTSRISPFSFFGAKNFKSALFCLFE
jgi:hypothetical protein